MQNTLMEVQSKFSGADVNLLMPISNEAQINPFYKFTVMEVKADVSEKSGDIFKVGSVKTGTANGKDIYSDVFSPAKPLLMKLAAAAGIQFDPNNTFGTFITKNCYKAKAYGAMRMPDGTGKTHCDEKVINLDDEEDRFRLEFMDKALQGITEQKAAQEAAKLFKGEWVDAEDKWGKKCKAFKIADEDRQKYIDRSVLVNMTLLRKTFAEKAMTGAILRVIRALIGMKGTYTLEELKKPFVIPRVTFSPDYNNPEVRRAMLEQGMSSVTNMFGGSRALAAAPSYLDQPAREDFNPEDFSTNAAFASDALDPDDSPFGSAEDFSDPESDPEEEQNAATIDQNDPNQCQKCGAKITDKVSTFAIKNFGKPLCMSCQHKGGAAQ
ncbi:MULTISPECIES: hypothetical protein [unclassified Dehalobacter]|uniref:hypothetical protein n=1 Tax=unclassified Dehalobacter TaxID=2635733 RepID=UPI001053CADE|nr:MULTISPECIES: hypothetical protein [unclassified Dehalobacter]TCX51974.1 hypothetical protein C1I36_06550 [Dehalobacter sp. 14DCB1]TCX53034.1 hypothetical protein C1I38_08230 [Dehalobacter sp. 12DCB1]